MGPFLAFLVLTGIFYITTPYVYGEHPNFFGSHLAPSWSYKGMLSGKNGNIDDMTSSPFGNTVHSETGKWQMRRHFAGTNDQHQDIFCSTTPINKI
jgi:hypothetical protein